jgi:poly-gamma-glutamate capsule biosynthesis protein CapA/YwtB (metallophosphatase superfamily)
MALEMEKQWRCLGSTRHCHCQRVVKHITVGELENKVDLKWLLLLFLLVLAVALTMTCN